MAKKVDVKKSATKSKASQLLEDIDVLKPSAKAEVVNPDNKQEKESPLDEVTKEKNNNWLENTAAQLTEENEQLKNKILELENIINNNGIVDQSSSTMELDSIKNNLLFIYNELKTNNIKSQQVQHPTVKIDYILNKFEMFFNFL